MDTTCDFFLLVSFSFPYLSLSVSLSLSLSLLPQLRKTRVHYTHAYISLYFLKKRPPAPSLLHTQMVSLSKVLIQTSSRGRGCLAPVTVYLAPLGSLPPGGEDTPGYLAPRPGYLHPRAARYPSQGILPPMQNILSIKSFFLFSYVKTYYFYHISFIIMMMTHVHSCKQITLNT